MGFAVLSDDEVEDFYSSIKQLGFKGDDFGLSSTSAPIYGSSLHTVAGTVTVKRKSTGHEKTYTAGHDSSWPALFHDDLAKGFFGAR